MKKIFFLLAFLIVLFSNLPAYAKFPVHLGGFALGEDIAEYQELIDLKSFREIPLNKYLKEGEIISRPEFKSGVITCGLCDKPGKILKIKLKFSDSSNDFFKKLVSRYNKNFGAPDEYKGDSFRIMIAWKWSFTNNKDERISLILKHNNMDEEEKLGNSVKLTLTTQIEKERNCFMKNFPDNEENPGKTGLTGKALWHLLVPY